MIKILAFIFIFIVLILLLSIDFYKNSLKFNKKDLLHVTYLSVVVWVITVLIVFMFSLSDIGKIYVDEYHSDNIFDTISIENEEYFIFSEIDLVIPKDKVSIHTVNSDDSSYRIVESKVVLDDNIATSLYSIDNIKVDIIYDIYIPK